MALITNATSMEAIGFHSGEDGLRQSIREHLEELRQAYALLSRLDLSDPIEAKEADSLAATVQDLAEEVRDLAVSLSGLSDLSEAGSAIADATLVAVEVAGDGLIALLAGHELS